MITFELKLDSFYNFQVNFKFFHVHIYEKAQAPIDIPNPISLYSGFVKRYYRKIITQDLYGNENIVLACSENSKLCHGFLCIFCSKQKPDNNKTRNIIYLIPAKVISSLENERMV